MVRRQGMVHGELSPCRQRSVRMPHECAASDSPVRVNLAKSICVQLPDKAGPAAHGESQANEQVKPTCTEVHAATSMLLTK